jgi:hypothetical protein
VHQNTELNFIHIAVKGVKTDKENWGHPTMSEKPVALQLDERELRVLLSEQRGQQSNK